MRPTLRLSINPRSTYYESDLRQGAALIRARKPFLIKNTLTGLGMFGLAASIYLYTLRAVAQDEFEDVPIPSASSAQGAKGPEAGGADTATIAK